jgi:ABC-type amino acid transport system permease subunit
LRAWSHCRAALLGRHGALGDLQFVANRVLAAAIYLVMLWPIARLISRLERRIAA